MPSAVQRPAGEGMAALLYSTSAEKNYILTTLPQTHPRFLKILLELLEIALHCNCHSAAPIKDTKIPKVPFQRQ